MHRPRRPRQHGGVEPPGVDGPGQPSPAALEQTSGGASLARGLDILGGERLADKAPVGIDKTEDIVRQSAVTRQVGRNSFDQR